jgi:GTP-binding protein EngB required for normal cell division
MRQTDVSAARLSVLSRREAILEEIAAIYTQSEIGILAIAAQPTVAKCLKAKIYQPQKTVTVLILGGHSTGKSSFVNWFFGDAIQKVSTAIETTQITLITTGRKRQSFDGVSTIKLFPFLAPYQSVPNFVENLSTEMRLPVESRSSLVTFIDTPGLIPDCNRLPFDCPEVMLKLITHAQLVFVFMDPIGQAFSAPLREFVQKAHPQYGPRMHFFLTKADMIDEDERTRIVSSISQTLSATISKRTLDVRPFSLPGESIKGRGATEEDAHANALPHLCELVETAVNNTVQANGSQLSQDLVKVTHAAQLALAQMGTRKRCFRISTAATILVLGYLIMAVTSRRVYFFSGLPFVVVGFLILWIITLFLRPSGRDVSRIEAFLNRTARNGQAKADEYFRRLTADDEEK